MDPSSVSKLPSYRRTPDVRRLIRAGSPRIGRCGTSRDTTIPVLQLPTLRFSVAEEVPPHGDVHAAPWKVTGFATMTRNMVETGSHRFEPLRFDEAHNFVLVFSGLCICTQVMHCSALAGMVCQSTHAPRDA